jgi:hypothetical protein
MTELLLTGVRAHHDRAQDERAPDERVHHDPEVT